MTRRRHLVTRNYATDVSVALINISISEYLKASLTHYDSKDRSIARHFYRFVLHRSSYWSGLQTRTAKH